MKIAHMADLHLGKVLNHFSLIDDQAYMLNQILQMMMEEKVEVLLLSGDVYDKAIPSVEAIRLLNDFLTHVHSLHIDIYTIAGNHDNGERLGFGNELFANMNIHIAGTYQGKPVKIEAHDKYGRLNFILIPYLRPAHINRYIENDLEKKSTYTEAMKYVIDQCNLDTTQRNILLAHQFVIGAQVDENGSETFEIGGIDYIDSSIFHDFDYVALGHIHRPQYVGKETIRYSGTMLAYSFSELKYEKKLTIIDLKEKGQIDIKMLSLIPKRKMIRLEGYFLDIIEKSKQYQNYYVAIILNDEIDVPEANERLRIHFPYLMTLEYNNQRTRYQQEVYAEYEIENKSMLEIFSNFYEVQNHQKLSEKQLRYLKCKIDQLAERGE